MPVAEHSDGARRQEIALQRGTKVLWRPSPHGAVDRQRRAVDAIGSAENACRETTAEQPCVTIVLQMRRAFAQHEEPGEENNHHGQCGLHELLVCAAQQPYAETGCLRAWARRASPSCADEPSASPAGGLPQQSQPRSAQRAERPHESAKTVQGEARQSALHRSRMQSARPMPRKQPQEFRPSVFPLSHLSEIGDSLPRLDP